jgi:SWI/SNF-related matrix-associated actin-dependent regulator of chromatin subfamily B member 1
MRPTTMNLHTDTAERHPLEPGAKPPEGVGVMYLPRIRCNDCPGKLYTALPGKVVDDFEVHLRNRKHRDNVDERRRREGR